MFRAFSYQITPTIFPSTIPFILSLSLNSNLYYNLNNKGVKNTKGLKKFDTLEQNKKRKTKN